jgi:uncharacterized surface protein with fasciclin (FAS1) repeats
MQDSNKSMITAIIAVIVVILGGIGVYTLVQDDETTEVTTSTSQQAETNEPVEQEAQTLPNIVEAAVATPSLSTLVTAVTEAELVETLSGEGPFTVLAPSNEAFANALEALDITVEELLAREDLGDILTYHVISGSVLSTDLSDGLEVTTVQGGTLTVDITEEGVFFVDANGGRSQVTTPDVETSNGVVHIIDAVLLP